MLGDPQQLCAEEATDNAREPGISGTVWEIATSKLALKDPQPDERADGDEDAETGDLELSDAKEDWIDLCPSPVRYCAGRRALLDVCEWRIFQPSGVRTSTNVSRPSESRSRSPIFALMV